MEHVSEAFRNKINSDLHVMAKNLKNIGEIWNEHGHVINGCPSLRSLESTHGVKWRNDPSGCGKNKWFNQVSICLEVDHLIKTGLIEKDAAHCMQSRLDDFPKKENRKNLQQIIEKKSSFNSKLQLIICFSDVESHRYLIIGNPNDFL